MAGKLRSNIRYKSPIYQGTYEVPGSSGQLNRVDKRLVENWIAENTLGTTTEGYVDRDRDEIEDEGMNTWERGFLFFDGKTMGKIVAELEYTHPFNAPPKPIKINYNVVVDIALSPANAKIPRSLESIFETAGFKLVPWSILKHSNA